MPSNNIEQGSRVKLSCELRSGGTFTDSTTVQVTVLAPSGATATYTLASGAVSRTAAGRYTVSLAVTEAGKWYYKWVSTSPDGVDEGTFLVDPLSVP